MEVDAALAAQLQRRLASTNVDVICADATAAGLESGRFSAATCFAVLHHMSSPEHQDRLLAEVHRMLRPGGIFVGTDSRDLDLIRAGHVGDIFVPVDPDTLAVRLETVGFGETTVHVGRDRASRETLLTGRRLLAVGSHDLL